MVLIKKILIYLLIFSQTSFAMEKIQIQWHGNKNRSCKKQMKVFLEELQNIALDQIIEFEAHPKKTEKSAELINTQVFKINCEGSHQLSLIDENSEKLTLNYLFNGHTIDANDWLKFQKKYLRPIDLPKLKRLSSIEKETVIKKESKSILKSPWFWGSIAVIGAGAFYFSQQRSTPRVKAQTSFRHF